MHPERLLTALVVLIFSSCADNALPKPKAMLRLEYPQAKVTLLETPEFKFDYNDMARVKPQEDGSLTLDYPKLKGSIYLTYKMVDGNLEKLLMDAQKLSLEHVAKADAIESTEYINEAHNVYGMFYEVKGDAASQAQFYATDSTGNFLTGSLYFYAKPNYDSIYPAALYLQKDIRTIMETLQWN